MNISSTITSQVGTTTAQSDTAEAVGIAVLKKALDLEEFSAITLLQALPQPPLAKEGNVGTNVNTFA